MRDFVLLSLLTGARRQNVLTMRWDQISFERAEWRIPETKNGSPQTVALTGEAIAILQSRHINGEWVFPGSGRTGHLVSPKKGWKSLFDHDELNQLVAMITATGGAVQFNATEGVEARLEKARAAARELKLDLSRARIRDLRIHDLRRTMGSWQAKTGASLAIIGKTLHHKSIAATQVYARLDLDPVRDAIEGATEAMLTAAAATKRGEAAAHPTQAPGSYHQTG
jgi:integrase